MSRPAIHHSSRPTGTYFDLLAQKHPEVARAAVPPTVATPPPRRSREIARAWLDRGRIGSAWIGRLRRLPVLAPALALTGAIGALLLLGWPWLPHEAPEKVATTATSAAVAGPVDAFSALAEPSLDTVDSSVAAAVDPRSSVPVEVPETLKPTASSRPPQAIPSTHVDQPAPVEPSQAAPSRPVASRLGPETSMADPGDEGKDREPIAGPIAPSTVADSTIAALPAAVREPALGNAEPTLGEGSDEEVSRGVLPGAITGTPRPQPAAAGPVLAHRDPHADIPATPGETTRASQAEPTPVKGTPPASRVVPPARLVSPLPTYTEEAWVHGIQGDVKLRAHIDDRGLVTGVEVLAGLPYGLTRSALDAVLRWRFRPALRDGRPTACQQELALRFTL